MSLPWIESIETYLMIFGPLAVFVIVFLDSLGAPLPTELSLLLAGYLISTGAMSPLGTLLVASLFVIVFLDSLGAPLPTELSLLLAGYLISTGAMSPLGTLLVAITGAIAGSALAYRLGRGAGKALVKRYGRYFRIGEAEMEKTTKWFQKHGEKAVLIGRFVPFVRNLVSYPAGTVGMAFGRFALFTILGYAGWIGVSLYLGYAAGENWTLVLAYIEEFTWVMTGLVVVGGGAWYLRRRYIKNGRGADRR
jgi:membrane protein DedA with SNARE-associated domain